MHQQHPGLLVVEEHEAHKRHVVVRHRDEPGPDGLRIGAVPLSDGELLVLATPGALRVPSLASALPELLREYTTGIDLLWLGVGGLAAGTEAAQRLAEDFGIEIAAPDGGLVAVPGAAMYAGHGAGGTGWHRFRPDRLVSFHGARFPLPKWESWLPAEPVPLGDVVATPVPCGLLVRTASAEGATAVDTVFDIGVNPRFPKIIVTVPAVAEVAALLGGLPPHPVMVVPATPEAAKHTWQIELALRLSQDVVFSAGPQLGGSTVVPGGRFQPFPIVLRQAARGGDQQVLAVAPPPPGWDRAGPRSYRFAEGDGVPVLADVVPAGLVLRAEEGDPDPGAEAAPFDPGHWTLTLGAAGRPLGLPVLAAAERLLEALPHSERAAVRVRMAGVPDREAAHALDHRAANRKPTPPSPPPYRPLTRPALAPSEAARRGFGSGLPGSVPSRPSGERGPVVSRPMVPTAVPVVPSGPVPLVAPSVPGDAVRRRDPESGLPGSGRWAPVGSPMPGGARPVPPVVPAGPGSPFAPRGPGRMNRPPMSPTPMAPPHPAAAPPSIMTTSRAPVSTVSSGMSSSTVAGQAKAPSPPREEPSAETARMEPVELDAGAEPEGEASPPAGPQQQQQQQPGPPTRPERSAPSVEREPGPPASPAIRSVAVPVRASTTGEQNRFVVAAGEDFGIALATVNAALATWPSMHAEDSPAGKADYVAVCLYLSRGEGAASLVNGVLRTGEGAVLDGHVPCLMSGLRRLPTHRRAVLRQGRVAESLEHRGDPGTVLTEPGFLAASMDLDVTVPGADLDVLIWPASARRTSELMLSRPVGEAVFTAGARFKTLAVRSVPDDEQVEPEDDRGALIAPKVAVLFRELAPGENPESADLDDRDRAVLAKLDSVLEGRRSAALRLVEDPDAIARLTTSMVLWRDEAAGEGKSVAVAS